MNPYERTAEEMKRQSEGPKRFAKTALGIGSAVAGAASFSNVLSRAAPFLSQYIPEDLAIKGLSKINPKLGKFVQDAMNSGYDFNEVKNFIGEQVQQSGASSAKNIIEQYSPELDQFIKSHVQKGKTALEAGALATIGEEGKKFNNIIKKITKEHKSPWSSILQSIYGASQQGAPKEQQQQSVQQQGQQIGPGQQALMNILQTINQKLGQ